ncbi:MAG: hypothetical protein WBQ04_00955 [Candidatus Acidiferrales bacterium]
MAVDTERIIRVAAELKDAQDRVKQLEAELQNLVHGSVPLFNLLADSSTPERIIALLQTNPSKDFSFPEIYREIGGNQAYIRSLLARLMKEQRIQTRGWGKYGVLSDMANPEKVKEKLAEKLRAVKP